MASSGRSIASAALLGVAVLLFVPVFADAGSAFSYGSWAYGPYVATVLEYLPLLLATTGVVILLTPILRR